MIKFDVQKLPNGLIGFKNNVCYANSILQLLLSIPDFRQWCFDNQNKQSNNQILNNLIKFVCCYINSTNNSENNLNLWGVHNELLDVIFKSNNIRIKNGVQFDASEFLDLLLDNIQLNNLIECKTNRIVVVDDEIVNNTNSVDLMLSLPILDDSKPINNLEELLRVYQKTEIINDYKHKNNIVQAKIITKISSTSKYLFINLRRYSNNGQYLSKINHFVDIPLITNIGKLTNQNEDKIYHLIARINHFGSINGGHYTSDIYSYNQNLQHWCWYHCSDNKITINHELNNDLNECGYIYVYKYIPNKYYQYIFKNISKNL